jgi:predicted transcriptional regulator
MVAGAGKPDWNLWAMIGSMVLISGGALWGLAIRPLETASSNLHDVFMEYKVDQKDIEVQQWDKIMVTDQKTEDIITNLTVVETKQKNVIDRLTELLVAYTDGQKLDAAARLELDAKFQQEMRMLDQVLDGRLKELNEKLQRETSLAMTTTQAQVDDLKVAIEGIRARLLTAEAGSRVEHKSP